MRSAVVIGSKGQDGSLLIERLEREGLHVIGVARTDLDLGNLESVRELVRSSMASELYYLAAHHQSSEQKDADDPSNLAASIRVHVTGIASVLECVRLHSPDTRVVYAASSHIFGNPSTTPQNEQTPIAPLSIYGITKACGAHLMHRYRAHYGLFASVAILYNHESPRRRPAFVSQRIIQGTLAILNGQSERLVLGDRSAVVDWGFAPDYVEAMIRIVRHDDAGDFVVATGTPHTVGELADIVFALAGLDPDKYIVEEPQLLRGSSPALIGDSSRLRQLTGWQESVSFEQMVTRLWEAASTSP